MLQWQLQAGLLLSLVLLCWHTPLSSAAPCTSETCSSLARSWEGARAAAKAAYERNLQAAGLAGNAPSASAAAQAAPAEPTAASAPANVPASLANVVASGAAAASADGVYGSLTLQAGFVAKQQVQQLQEAVEQLEAAIMKETNIEQLPQEVEEHKEVAIHAQNKQQASHTAPHAPQAAASAAAATAADAGKKTASSITAVHTFQHQLQQLEVSVCQLEAALHSSKLQLQQHGQTQTANAPITDGQACSGSSSVLVPLPSTSPPLPAALVVPAAPAAAKLEHSKAAAGLSGQQQVQQLDTSVEYVEAYVQHQKQDGGRLQQQPRQAEWSFSSTLQARTAAAASALAAAASAGQKRVAAAAVAGQEQLTAGFATMSEKVPAGLAALQEKLPAAIPLFSSKASSESAEASSCAATQQEVQELRAAVQQLEAKLGQQQQEWQQQAGQNYQHMWLLIYPCLIFLGWLLRGFGAQQVLPAAAAEAAAPAPAAAASTKQSITNAAAKIVVSTAAEHPRSSRDAAQISKNQHLQEHVAQPLLARAAGSNNGNSGNSSSSNGGGDSGNATGGPCSALHTAEAPAGEEQSGVQRERQPAHDSLRQGSLGATSGHAMHSAAAAAPTPAGEVALQQQASTTSSSNTSSNEFTEVTAVEVQGRIHHSSSGGSSNSGRRGRRVTSSAGRRSRRATSQGAGSGAVVVQQQQQQQQLGVPQQGGVIVACSEETMKNVIQPAVMVLTQLSHGMNTLAVATAAVVHHLSQVTSMGTRLATQVEQLLSFAGKQEKQQQLAAQQALGERSGQLGLALLLLALGASALKVGRFWEVHEVCSGSSSQHPSSWVGRMTGTSTVNHAWQYTTCCVHQLGLYAVGLVVLYQLALVTWRGLFSSRHGNSNISSRSWQLDLFIFRGAVCSIVGVHVVHCLGAAWLPWLLLWLVWVVSQVLLQVKQLQTGLSALMVLNVALVLPLCMAVAPFHPRGVLLQGWLLEEMPWLHQLMVVPKLLGLQW